jgi:diguanylate cyclase (GGDEF)-like protein
VKALVCEPDLGIRAVISRALFLRGHEPSAHGEFEAALADWQTDAQPLVVVGWQDGRALAFCRQIRSMRRGADIVLLVVGRDLPRDLLLLVAEYADDLVAPDLKHLTARIAVAERRVADMELRRLAQEQLVRQALHDTLTDLPNRALLFDRLTQGLHAAQRQGTNLALLIIDLDRFKDVNDTYGHHAGDLVLREVADRLRATLRSSDTVGRIGGDELAVLLPSIGETENAVVTARQIVETLSEPYMVDGHAVTIGASLGLALFPIHGTDDGTLLLQADAAMYAAKRSGGGIALASAELSNAPLPARTPIDQVVDATIRAGALAPPDAARLAPNGRRSQAELLRTLGQRLDRSGTSPRAIICEGNGYRVRDNGTEQWFPMDELVRESKSRALRRQPHPPAAPPRLGSTLALGVSPSTGAATETPFSSSPPEAPPLPLESRRNDSAGTHRKRLPAIESPVAPSDS